MTRSQYRSHFNKRLIISALLLVCFSLPLSAEPQKAKPVASLKLDSFAPAALSQTLKTVIQRHPRKRAAEANLNASRAAVRAADNALYNPELEIDSEKTDINTSYIQLSQTIDWGDQRGSRTSVAQSMELKAIADYQIAIQDLSHNLLTAIAEKRTRDEQAILAGRALQLMQEFTDIAEQRFNAGDLNQVELDLARLANAEALMTHAQALSEAAAAKEGLRAIFITQPANLPDLPDELPMAYLPVDSDNYVRSLPAMRALEADVSAKRQLVELRKSERSWNPTIALRGGKEDDETLLGATLSIPLNIRNTYRAEVEEAQQALISSEQMAQQMFLNQRARVFATTERYRLLQQAWTNWKKIGRVSVNRQLSLIKKLWRAGDMSTTEYLVQLKQALDTQSAGYELRGLAWQASFDWLLVTASINQWLQLTVEEN
ncbi:hypothetical protein MNBD_GAMMA25-370 [hydrothermal vent metagenome]|uniref:Heavy metal RND efflux outer membrane protein, CzcC family n=1 Tax=hydrothermal vent metagenome TaxID=652676 RepID=A0A3B1B084_9ZZZZ